ncbi:MAG TPA: PCYCGC motif-containing (lipo)protein [Dehalococcoidia bacterium]|nr:PCYCGC motif-containing (lipo)protein [Dehalococcoidia bacterium]
MNKQERPLIERVPPSIFVLAVAGLVLLGGLGIVFLAGGGSGPASPAASVPPDQTADTVMPGGVQYPDYVVSGSADVAMAYQFAMDRPDAMMWMPCYCGCGGHSGHKSARNCFIKEGSTSSNIQFDEHGAGCAMCVSIALDVKKMTEEGQSLRETRLFIDGKYGGNGGGTNTPMPPG